MSPLDQIRNGINNASWKDVALGFKALTGEIVEPPSENETQNNNYFHYLVRLRNEINELVGGNEEESELDDQAPEEDDVVPVPIHSKPPEITEVSEQKEENPDPMNKFRIQNGTPKQENADGKVAAKALPWEPPGKKNRFKDDKKSLKKEDKELSYLPKERTERREAPQMVKAKCSRCPKEEMIPVGLARKADKDDDVMSYICDKCVVHGRGI